MEPLSFWLVALGAPLALVVGNSLVRWVTGLPQSAPADIILALIGFDYVVVAQTHDFESYVRNALLRSNLTAIYALLMFIGMICWVLAVFWVEGKLAIYQEARRRPLCDHRTCPLHFNDTKSHSFPYLGYFLSLFIPTIQIFGSVFPFTYR